MRRKNLYIIVTLLFTSLVFGMDFPEERRTEKELFPRPMDGAISDVNPPAFVWLPVKNAHHYKVQIMDENGALYIVIQKLPDNLLCLQNH